MLCAKECTGNAISTKETVKVKLAGHDVEWGKLDEKKCRIAFRGGNPEANPFYLDRTSENIMWHGEGWEGAKGCIRACMIHLESKKALKNTFKEPFRQKKTWSLPNDWKKDIPESAPRLGPSPEQPKGI
jgi:hypothetical protein